MGYRIEKSVEALENNPSVAYAEGSSQFNEVWCGITTGTTEEVDSTARAFGLVEPMVKIKNHDEHGLILDIWWLVDPTHETSEHFDADEWIRSRDNSVVGEPIEEIVNG